MQLSYPSHHRWQRPVFLDPLAHFSTRTASKIRSALEHFESKGITYSIEPLSEVFLERFIPLYTQQIGEKENAVVHDVRDKTFGLGASKFPYYAFSLFENGLFVGGIIFSLRRDRISFAYRTFHSHWSQTDIKISPAYIGEYATARFASEHDLSYISHGRDRNPYGLNAAIGLATFKLSAGCQAYVAEEVEIKTIDTTELTADALILALPSEGKLITNAYLVTSRENESKYVQVTKYPDQLAVEVLYRE